MACISIQSALEHAITVFRRSEFSSDGQQIHDARGLLCFVLEAPTSHLITHADQLLTCHQWSRFQSLVARRSHDEPMAYLTGERGFWTMDVKVTSDVLDPRPDTETLVQACLDYLDASPKTVLDAGTGSGVVAGALVRERPGWQLLASDLSLRALRVAAENLKAPAVPLVCGDWTAAFSAHSLDAIVSNPPYLAGDDPHLSALRHEPHMALVADEDGLGAFMRIIGDASRVLNPDGWLFLEHGYTQQDAVIHLLRGSDFQLVHRMNDLGGNPRVVVARLTGDHDE